MPLGMIEGFLTFLQVASPLVKLLKLCSHLRCQQLSAQCHGEVPS